MVIFSPLLLEVSSLLVEDLRGKERDKQWGLKEQTGGCCHGFGPGRRRSPPPVRLPVAGKR
jgi:hypothetical protein